MRHQKNNKKFGRSTAHRAALVSTLVASLAKDWSICTTVVKAKVARSVAEKMVTLARKGNLASRRLIASRLRDEDAAKIFCTKIAPLFEGRPGGYTRIVKTGARGSDGSEMAVLTWVVARDAQPPKKDAAAPAEAPAAAEA